MYNKNNVKRMCSFYVNDVHLITMLLPYIERKIKGSGKFYTFFEKDYEKVIQMLLSKLNLKEELKEKINSINWNNKKEIKYEKIKERLDQAKNDKEIYLLVNGSNEYIKNVNLCIDRYLKKNELKINIINCYDIVEFNKNIIGILNKSNKILNTSGEHEIEEIFPEYKKQKKNA